jgi:hypothetical protein
MAGRGNGRSMGTARSRPISLSSTPILRSMRLRGRHATSTRSGQTEPTTIKAVRTPYRLIMSEPTMAPRPTASATRLSKRPNTRASTSSPASLAIKVNTPRSTSAFPTPTKASRAQTVAGEEESGTSTRGKPQSATPTANHWASRADPTSKDAASDPITAPAPMAAVRVATPGAPIPSRSNATTTLNTVSAPRVNACAAPRPMSSDKLRS